MNPAAPQAATAPAHRQAAAVPAATARVRPRAAGAKVLMVITGLGMGGAERVAADLADALAADGYEVLMVYLTGDIQVRPRNPDVGTRGLGIDSVFGILAGYRRLRRIVREFRPAIIHSHMFHATLLTRMLRLSMPVPRMISTMHTGHPRQRRLRSWAYRLTDRLTDISTNVSCEAVDAFTASRAVGAGRMVAIHNGIDVDIFRPSTSARAASRRELGVGEHCRMVLAVGRLNWSKDYPNLFDALLRLPADLDYRLFIAGDGPLRAQLEAAVAARGLGDRVRFLGIRRDVPALMCACDVFVLPSVWESFGLVVAESMACEGVVVATDSGGVREVLGDAGFLVPPRDPAAFAEALTQAMSLSDAAAAELGAAARQRIVEQYSFARARTKWRELYRSMLAN